MRHAPRQYLETDNEWDEHLHGLLGASWPCHEAHAVDELMLDVAAILAANGLQTGEHTYGGYSDGAPSLCQAAWCVAIHTRPDVVIETGVAHGLTSRVVLEALRHNGRGRLWSIDLPHPLEHRLHGETGVVVTDQCRDRWSYVKGSSRQRLGPLIAEVGRVDMFIHDSLHTTRNTLFEMERAASAMVAGGVMLIDDVETNDAFDRFAKRHPDWLTIRCPAADRSLQFGIVVKQARTSGSRRASRAKPAS